LAKVTNVKDKTVTVDFYLKSPYWFATEGTFYKTDKRLTSLQPTPRNIEAQVKQETECGCAQFKLVKNFGANMS